MADTFEWNGANFIEAMHTAVSRAQIAVGSLAVSEQKAVVHRLTGTLARSIHIAPKDYVGESDQAKAAAGLDLQTDGGGAAFYNLPTWVGDDAYLEEGSWIDYACVENNRHPYMAAGMDLAISRARAIYQQAFAEEGISLR